MARRRRHHRRGHRRRTEDEGAEQQEVAPAIPPSRPHFFKIILSHTLESGKLGIPKSFLRRYGKDLSGLVLLKVAGGLTWPVKLEKGDNDVVWLWKGWRKFMDHYSIGHGHLLVFKYEGDSVFRVIIFDKSASEIDYPSSIGSYGASPEGECLSRKEENVVEIEDSEGFAPRSRPSSNGSSREFGGWIKIEQSQHRESSSMQAFHFFPCLSPVSAYEKARGFESDHPFFKMVMQPYHVQKYLSIPCEFFRKHLQKNKQKQVATLRYLGSSWQVKLWSSDHRGTACLSIGWPSFIRETGLRVRDVCVFELIDRDDVVFRVSIFSSDGRIEIEQSQDRESSSAPAFHFSPCLSLVSAYEKARGFESDHPFFKMVMQPSHVRKYLSIPCEFFRKHLQKNKQKEVATLRHLGSSWQVKLWSSDHRGMACLSIGWPSFARETGLRVRDVCVFELIDRDDVVFRVSIFSSDGRIEIEQSQCQESSSEMAFDGSPHPCPVTVHEKVSKFESEYPFFHVILPNHISRNLNIPWEFMKTYVPGDQRTATLVNSGRSWEVKLYGYERSHTAILAAGWSAFAREACLRKGDACVFELVDRDRIVFRVSILICVNKKVICIA
ncbi:hypothetical protein BT93_G0280 [Corymbia citriodora subsp. variegata]|nr:hypothetical protein BT93_G0280 [Corymbia citriodora subsp. variegata]